MAFLYLQLLSHIHMRPFLYTFNLSLVHVTPTLFNHALHPHVFFLLVTFNYSLVSAIPILLLTMHGIQTFLVQIIIMDNGRVQHQGSPYDIARADHDLEVKWKEAVRRASVTEDVRTAESSTEMERKSLRRQCSRKFSVVSHTDSVIGKLKPNAIFFLLTLSHRERKQ